MQGSKAYVAGRDLASVVAMYSLELCGIGDMVAVWDSREAERSRLGIRTLLRTLKEMGADHAVVGEVPRFASDHRRFAERGVPAVGLTVLPRRDETRLREFVFRPGAPKWAERANRPYVFRLYHSPEDRSEALQEGAIRLMAEVIRRAVRNLERALRAPLPWCGTPPPAPQPWNPSRGAAPSPFGGGNAQRPP